jgi:anti-sigma-K factor RskA
VHLDADELTLLALGEPADDAAADHLASCPQCRAELAALTATVSLARAGGPETAAPLPPASVWAGIAGTLDFAGAAATPDGTAGSATSPGERARADALARPRPASPPGPDPAPVAVPRPWFRRTGPLTAAAALALIVAMGVGWAVGRTTKGTPAPSVVSSAALAPLPDSPEQAASGTARIERSGDQSLLSVDASGLPAPDGFYEVWLFDPGSGAMVPMGNLDPGQRGTFPMPPNLDPGHYPVVDISAEKFDNDPEHSEVSVLRGKLSS